MEGHLDPIDDDMNDYVFNNNCINYMYELTVDRGA
jgi:hypothetical protein